MTGFESHVERAKAVDVLAIIRDRDLQLKGKIDLAGPCPNCGGKDRFSINTIKRVFNCRGCGARGHGAIDLIMFMDGCDFKTAVDIIAGNGQAPRRSLPTQGEKPAERDDNAKRRDIAAIVWRSSRDPRGTLAEIYLKSRALELPGAAAGEAIRFHGRCKFDSEWHPAMVCLARDIITNKPQGIHRTALAPDGTAIKRNGKTYRLSLGLVAGGAIKIDPDEEVTQGLCIGEGVETCLSGKQMGLQPVWSVLNASGVENFPVLSYIDGLHIFRENDANGRSQKAVETCADRWLEAGREVLTVTPDVGNDLNDELRGAPR